MVRRFGFKVTRVWGYAGPGWVEIRVKKVRVGLRGFGNCGLESLKKGPSWVKKVTDLGFRVKRGLGFGF